MFDEEPKSASDAHEMSPNYFLNLNVIINKYLNLTDS